MRERPEDVVVAAKVLARRELDRAIAVLFRVGKFIIPGEDRRGVQVLKDETLGAAFLQVLNRAVDFQWEFLLHAHAPIQESWLTQGWLIHQNIRHQRRSGGSGSSGIVVS